MKINTIVNLLLILILSVQHEKECYRDFANANYEDINNDILSIDWYSILENQNSLQSKIDNSYNVSNEIIDEHVKIDEMKESNNPFWYDKKAINLKNRINRMHKKMKVKNTEDIKDTQYHFDSQ